MKDLRCDNGKNVHLKNFTTILFHIILLKSKVCSHHLVAWSIDDILLGTGAG